MKTILIPTDFSDNAKHAFTFAVRLFRGNDVKFLLLNVSDRPYTKGGMMIDIHGEIKRNAEEDLQNEKADLVAKEELTADLIETVFHFGDVAKVINAMASEQNIDLVVMGTKGATGLKEVFLGSNTNDVFKNVAIPTIAVPAGYPVSDIKSAVFASDLQTISDFSVLNPLKELLTLTKAELEVLHLYWNENEHAENKKVLLDDLAKFNPTFNQFFSANVGEELVNYVNTQSFNMLAILMRERGFFDKLFHDSVTKELAFHAEIPVFVIHE